ncbi:MAG: LCP family protein [Firmicutes bacterium]|nr:LCP family protein [Bacillota bacterium]
MGKHVWRDDDPLLSPDGGSRRTKRKWLFWLGIILLLALISAGTAYYTYWVNFKKLEKPEVAKAEPPVTILALGTDKREHDLGRADTLMVINLDPKYQTVRVISLPRDTRVKIPGYEGYHRINTAYGFGGPELVEETVEELLGLEIDYYVSTDFAGFAEIIDAVGGVVIDVEKPMHYDDNAQDLHIHLEPGRQRLSGKDALAYVRFRGDGLGDISLVDPVNNVYEGRIQRQQKFLKAVAAQVLDPKNIWRAPALIKRLSDVLETNMPLTTIMRYAVISQSIPMSNIITMVLPGQAETINGASYWVPDRAQLVRIVSSFKRPTPPPVVEEGDETRPIKVRVLNGNGTQGLARKAANILNQQGFETVEVGNAPSFDYAETQIILHTSAKRAASQVRSALKVYGQVKEEPAEESGVDVTVILGEDYVISD